MTIGTASRCLVWLVPSMSDQVFTILCHFCAASNAVSGIIFCSAPPLVSAAWFPPNERVTATSIGQAFNGIGSGLGFLIARVMVKSDRPHDETIITERNATLVTPEERDFFKEELTNYIFLLAGPPFLLFLMTLVNFPSKPRSPPSETAQIERIGLLEGAKDLVSRRDAWLVLVVVAVSQSIPGTWGAMMVVVLQTLNVDGKSLTEEWIDVLAVTASFLCNLVAILGARLTDRFHGHMKATVMVLLSASVLVFTLLTLVSIEVIKMPHFIDLQVSVFALFTLGSCLVTACNPLILELAVEICYPASEILSGGWIFFGYGMGSLAFLIVFAFPGVGTSWLNYMLPASSLVCIPLMSLVRENYTRLKLDKEALIRFEKSS